MSFFKCPGCDKFAECKTVNVRRAVNANGQRRRRECLGCGTRYSTVELIVPEGKRGYPEAEFKPFFEEDYQDEENYSPSDNLNFAHRLRSK